MPDVTALETADITALENLLIENNQILTHIYALMLWFTGVLGALFVLFLIYKFIKLFY